jgi:CxxC motif-containing protein
MEIVCIVCPKGCRLRVDQRGVTGNQCARGEAYGRKEAENPTRVVTSTVRVERAAHPRLPVKTDRDIPKRLIFDVMRALDGVTARAPVRRGDILLADVCGSGANIVATRDLPMI